MNWMSFISSTFSVGVHAGGGFVEQQQFRPASRARGRFPIAAGRRSASFSPARRGICRAEKFPAVPSTCAAISFSSSRNCAPAPERVRGCRAQMQVKRRAHVVEDGQRRKQPDVLERPRDAARGDVVRLAAGDAIGRRNESRRSVG